MKKIAKYILMAGVALMATACDKDSLGTGEGVASFDIRMSSESRTVTAVPEYLRVRIYREDGGLIRRYTSLYDIPETLYLVAGEYSVSAEAGDKENVAFLASDVEGEVSELLCYESDLVPFTIKAQQSTDIKVTAKTINVKAAVELDTEIAENSMLSDVVIRLAATNADVKSVDEFNTALTSSTPCVSMNGSDTAYFLMPEGETDADDVTSIVWSFEGVHSDDGAIAKVGRISVAKGKGYTVKFKYSRTPDGFVGPDEDGNGGLYVEVDETLEEKETNEYFKPQPEIAGQGINASGLNVYSEGSSVVLTCESINDLVTLSLGGVEFFKDGAVVADAISGVSCQKNANTKVTITLSAAYFAQMGGGENTLQFGMSDTGGDYNQKIKFLKQGLMVDKIASDLWANTATFSAVITDPSVTSVGFKFRKQGASAWSDVFAASVTSTEENGCKIYSATSTASWAQSTNSKGHTIYTPNVDKGIFANTTYEVQMVVGSDNANYGAVGMFATNGVQTIPYASFDDSALDCFKNTSSNGSAKYWGSGNNGVASGLCSYDTSIAGKVGSGCAKLAATYVNAVVYTTIAAGNLFTGNFLMSGTTGTVSFGVKYDWTSRPTAMKLKCYHNIGTVDYVKDSFGITSMDGQPDQASIYVAIVEWDTQHKTSSGTSAPSGVWSVDDGINAVSAGKIVGYGVVYPTGKTAGDSMTDMIIPIHYYDTAIKPNSNYTLVISAATSRYGDYMTGCTENVMYVDDFQWVY